MNCWNPKSINDTLDKAISSEALLRERPETKSKFKIVGRQMSHPKRTRKEIRGAIIGMIMGDASLYQNPYRDGSRQGNYKITIAHSPKQSAYLEHKREIINQIFNYQIPITDQIIRLKVTNKTYPAKRLMSRVNSRLTFIAKRVYIARKKRITPWVLDNITDEGLALWWMDDGCLHVNKAPRTGGFIVWGTYGFPKEDVELFQNWLVEKHNVYLRMTQHKKSGGWYLRRGMSEGVKLSNILRPYAISSMLYKFANESMFKMHPYNLPENLDYSVRPHRMMGDDIVQAI